MKILVFETSEPYEGYNGAEMVLVVGDNFDLKSDRDEYAKMLGEMRHIELNRNGTVKAKSRAKFQKLYLDHIFARWPQMPWELMEGTIFDAR